MTDDSDITRLLHGAVAGVEPERGSADLQAAIDRSGTGRPRWVRGAVAAAVVVVGLTAGTAYLHQRSGAGAPALASHDVDATVYYVGHTALGPRLFSENHTIAGVTVGDSQAAVDAALGLPDDPDYHSGFAAGTTATVDAGPSGDVVVDFAHTPALAEDSDARIALQSLVWTLDGVLQRHAPVRFTVDGAVPETLLGQPVQPSYQQADADAVLSPVRLDLDEGATVTSASDVHGSANAFEGNVVWTLRQGTTVVRRGFATAATCCTPAPFDFTLAAPPGAYTLTVFDTDPSGGEGNGVTSDSKDIQVQ